MRIPVHREHSFRFNVKPYETFAAMIERHWDGIAAYGRPEHKVS